MRDITNQLKDIVKLQYDLELLGPIPCIISKIRENYRWQIIIKGDFTLNFAKRVKDLLYESNKNLYTDIRISIDINPNNLI
jgi:primosomal protein N' (replication factor Y)